MSNFDNCCNDKNKCKHGFEQLKKLIDKQNHIIRDANDDFAQALNLIQEANEKYGCGSEKICMVSELQNDIDELIEILGEHCDLNSDSCQCNEIRRQLEILYAKIQDLRNQGHKALYHSICVWTESLEFHENIDYLKKQYYHCIFDTDDCPCNDHEQDEDDECPRNNQWQDDDCPCQNNSNSHDSCENEFNWNFNQQCCNENDDSIWFMNEDPWEDENQSFKPENDDSDFKFNDEFCRADTDNNTPKASKENDTPEEEFNFHMEDDSYNPQLNELDEENEIEINEDEIPIKKPCNKNKYPSNRYYFED